MGWDRWLGVADSSSVRYLFLARSHFLSLSLSLAGGVRLTDAVRIEGA